MARHNRPSLMIYGGSIKGGYSERLRQPINISSCFEAHGAMMYGKLTTDDLDDVIKNSCPGPGGCGGMYTANTMATALEAMGLTLPGSSSTPADSPAKYRECLRAAEAIKVLLEKDIKPRDLITRESFENAMVITMIMGGSTNAVLHFLAISHTADLDLTIDDFQRVADKIPVLADLKPSGKYMMADLADIGGMPAVFKFLIHAGLINGDILTVTGKTLKENVESAPSLDPGQDIIRPLSNPIKATGHIRILKGNLAPGGAVAKITGKEGKSFIGKARVYNGEEALIASLEKGEIHPEENTVLCVRYEGPKGGPGMVSSRTFSFSRFCWWNFGSFRKERPCQTKVGFFFRFTRQLLVLNSSVVARNDKTQGHLSELVALSQSKNWTHLLEFRYLCLVQTVLGASDVFTKPAGPEFFLSSPPPNCFS